ncbi:hypothetical protein [Streptomyces sp. NBC_01294]|uniref:hypothetical protein n=1 Tax=Streptomyces sp. NBC_01294 TaxID=2903815 RepID=UPI002DDB027B|nr:hypothetical protein [Streptomyces sp. NBC_01294]WRZ58108.1 hypothetical protein OG534_17355 [Streptomyces sp. NBC_01294]
MSVKKIAAALVPTTALLVLLVPAEASAATPRQAAPEKICSMSLPLPLPDLGAQPVHRPASQLIAKLTCVNGWQ